MAEPNAGQPQAENVAQTPVAAPQVEGQPTPPAPDIPEKYKGKSAEELTKILQDVEAHVGKLANEVGEERQKRTQYEQYLMSLQQAANQAAQQQQPPPVQPEKEEELPVDWYDKPARVIRRVSRETVDPQIQQLRKDMEANQAMNNFYAGKQIAESKRPDLFKGIENEVDQALQIAWRNGSLAATSLLDPETRYLAASAIRAKKSGYQQWGGGGGFTPVTPSSLETPMGVKPPENEERPITIIDEDETIDTDKMIAGLGFTKDKAMKLMREKK